MRGHPRGIDLLGGPHEQIRFMRDPLVPDRRRNPSTHFADRLEDPGRLREGLDGGLELGCGFGYLDDVVGSWDR